MHVVRWESADEYEPAGHAGVVNRLLVGRAAGGLEDVSIWHGTLEAGGHAETHVHDGSIQVYVALSGALDVETPTDRVTLREGDAATLERNEPHSIRNPHAFEPATLLVVSAPALR